MPLAKKPGQGARDLVNVARASHQHLYQKRKDKDKLNALHAPEVECIGKGKARKPFEFGVKLGITVKHQQSLIVGAKSFSWDPCHTLSEQIEQATILLEAVNVTPRQVVELDYRGKC